jgi:hypothetical protein
MALRFCDSVAHYGSSGITQKWTTSSPGLSGLYNGSGGRRNGAYLGGPNLYAKTLTHGTRWIQGAAVIHNNLRGGSLWLGNNGSTIMQLRMNGDSTMTILGGNATIGHSSLAVADPTSWHYYEIDTSLGAALGTVTLTCSLRVDGASFGSFSGASNVLTTNLIDNAATANQVGMALDTNGFMDYYAVDTSTTDINGVTSTLTTFLGDVEIDAIFPNSDVTTNWGSAGGDGTHAYTSVNAATPNYGTDTAYVITSSTATTSEGFKYQPITGFTGTIVGAQYLVLARKDAEGPRIIDLTVGTHTASTIEYQGTANYLSDYYVYYITPLDSDFGVAWTTAVLSTETFGFSCIG